MKKILLIGCMAMLALLPRPLHAQPLLPPTLPPSPNGSESLDGLFSSLFGNLFGGITQQLVPVQGLKILPTDQPADPSAVGGTVVMMTSIELDSLSYRSPVNGLTLHVTSNSPDVQIQDVIDGYVLLDEFYVPLGPIRTPSYRYSYRVPIELDETFWIYKGEPRKITASLLVKRGISAAYIGQYFSVSITDVITDSSVTGTLPVVGGLKTLKSGANISRTTFGVGVAVAQNVYPLASKQPGAELLVSTGPEGQEVPELVVAMIGEGGDMDDVMVSLVLPDGSVIAKPQRLVSSIYGQGTVTFPNPFHVDKETVGHCLMVPHFGYSWIDGGTASFFMSPTRCLVKGQVNGYLTIPSPRAILSWPVMTVLPVAVDIDLDTAIEIDTGSQLVSGINDFTAVEISAPADRALAIGSLGMWLGWMPVSDTIEDANIYGYLTYSNGVFSQPIPGLQSNGAFGKGMALQGRFGGVDVEVDDSNGDWSAGIIPAGGKGYFVLRGKYIATKAHSEVSSQIFDLTTGEPVAMNTQKR